MDPFAFAINVVAVHAKAMLLGPSPAERLARLVADLDEVDDLDHVVSIVDRVFARDLWARTHVAFVANVSTGVASHVLTGDRSGVDLDDDEIASWLREARPRAWWAVVVGGDDASVDDLAEDIAGLGVGFAGLTNLEADDE